MKSTPSLYGVLNHSLLFVHSMLERLRTEHDFTLSILDPNRKFRKGDIYLAVSNQVLQHFTEELEGQTGIVIVFETPVGLCELEDCKFLDGVQDQYANYQFKLSSLTDRKLVPLIKSLKRSPIIEIKRQKLEVLPDMINTECSGKFLDKMNTMLYYGLSSREQNAVRNEIVNYLYGKGKLNDLSSLLEQTLDSSTKSDEYRNNFLGYLKSKDGKALRTVTQQIGDSYRKDKATGTATLVKKHGIDKSEIVYLNQLYRKRFLKKPTA